MSVTVAGRIAELIVEHGGLRATARFLEVDAGYMSRLRSGKHDNPQDLLLWKMGLERVVTYRRLRPVAAVA